MKQQIQTSQIEWREVELGNERLFSILSSGINNFSDEKDYLSTESVQGTRIEKIECKITCRERPSRANMQPVFNSVWFAKMKSTIKVYSFSKNNEEEIEKYILSTGFAGIKLDKNISPDYVKFFFLTERFNEEKDKLSTGSTQSGINNSFISKIKIPLPFRNGQPDLEEQQRIVAILEQAERLKEQSKQAFSLLDEYLKSVFYEMFHNKGFETKKLDEICETSSGGTPSRAKKEYWENGKIPWIKSGDLNKNKITDVDEFITESGLKNSSAKYIEPNTVLIAMYGATAGKTSISKIKATTNQAVCALVPSNESLDKTYLLYWLRSNYQYIVSLSFGGGQPNISQQVIRSLRIPLPPLALQQRFASIVEQVETMKERVKKAQANTEELFNSLMQKAFRGEL